jgi:hypothetical protein
MPSTHATCACGAVDIVFHGAPIAALSCCCDDCQAAAARLEALPGAPRYTEPCGGTPALQFHRKAMHVVTGADKLDAVKLRDASPTSRMVARCCNSAMYIGFDRGPFWVTAFHARLDNTAPNPTDRIQTRYLKSPPPNDMRNHARFPLSLPVRIAFAGLTGLMRPAVRS